MGWHCARSRRDPPIPVEALALSGETVMVYGPLGIGKTAILGELARRAEQAGRPCAICPRTERLSDVTEALVRCYPTGTDALTTTTAALPRAPRDRAQTGHPAPRPPAGCGERGQGLSPFTAWNRPRGGHRRGRRAFARPRAHSHPRTCLPRAGAAAIAQPAPAAVARLRIEVGAAAIRGSRVGIAKRSSTSRGVGLAGSCVSR